MKHPLFKRLGALATLAACLTLGFSPVAAQSSRTAQTPAAIAEQFGGVYTGRQAAYVAAVGERIAAVAGMQGRCTFTLINSNDVNAFAVPNCSIFVTRGLLSIANSEDELAFVLGHEVGHMAARHSQKRQQTSLFAGLGAAILGAVTKSDTLGQLFGQGAQLYTLKYSRGQEHESDDLGLRYMRAAGYAPQAAGDMLRALQRNDALTARLQGRGESGSTPAWARTHPLTSDRVVRADNAVRVTSGPAYGPQTASRADGYYAAVDGMLFGEDPSQGFINGQSFAHPRLLIGFEAPRGFVLTNSSQAVGIQGPGGQKAQFAGGSMRGRSLEQYAGAVLTQVVGQAQRQIGQAQRVTINGIPAVVIPARVQTQGGVANLTVAAYQVAPDTAYHFVTLAAGNDTRAFDPLIGSFRRLSQAEAASLRPRVLQVVTVRPGDTFASLVQRMQIENATDWFSTLNNLSAGSAVQPGRRVKLVLYDR